MMKYMISEHNAENTVCVRHSDHAMSGANVLREAVAEGAVTKNGRYIVACPTTNCLNAGVYDVTIEPGQPQPTGRFILKFKKAGEEDFRTYSPNPLPVKNDGAPTDVVRMVDLCLTALGGSRRSMLIEPEHTTPQPSVIITRAYH